MCSLVRDSDMCWLAPLMCYTTVLFEEDLFADALCSTPPRDVTNKHNH